MNDEQLLRYSRQIMLPDFDIAGQAALLDSKVLIIGLGGLGCPVALYLAAAGVGELQLVDFDEVDLSNLQRQIAHGTNDIGSYKVDSVKASVEAINPDCKIVTRNSKLEGESLLEAVSQADVVVDASDNFASRFAINQACWALKKPLVSGAAIRTEGQVAVFDSRREDSPCYRCLYSDAGDDSQLSCSESGVMAPLVGIVGTVQAMEVIKVITGFGNTLTGKLLMLDAREMEWRSLSLPKDPACPVCGQ